jgi:hypothetical protein
MPHPLVDQFRFTRREWRRGLEGVSPEDAQAHPGRMNCISWIVGHLAWHEQRYWLQYGQGQVPYPILNEIYAYRAPMSTPDLEESLGLWEAITRAADPYLDTFTTEKLLTPLLRSGQDVGQSHGSALRRMTYHYWYHCGEILAIRQVLGQVGLPEYVGDIEQEAPYRPE